MICITDITFIDSIIIVFHFLKAFEMFYLSVFFFSEFPVEIKHVFSLIITGVNIYHHLLIKLQKRCYRYATALVENFAATFPQAIFLHAVNFCISYCNFSIPQSLGIFTYIYSANQVFLCITDITFINSMIIVFHFLKAVEKSSNKISLEAD